MSGGAFDYEEHKINSIADSIIELIASNSTREFRHSDGTIAIMRKVAALCQVTYEAVHAVDYRECADTGDESLEETWRECEAKLRALAGRSEVAISDREVVWFEVPPELPGEYYLIGRDGPLRAKGTLSVRESGRFWRIGVGEFPEARAVEIFRFGPMVPTPERVSGLIHDLCSLQEKRDFEAMQHLSEIRRRDKEIERLRALVGEKP